MTEKKDPRGCDARASQATQFSSGSNRPQPPESQPHPSQAWLAKAFAAPAGADTARNAPRPPAAFLSPPEGRGRVGSMFVLKLDRTGKRALGRCVVCGAVKQMAAEAVGWVWCVHDIVAKGMSVTAARELVDETCARFNVPLYILHDFDVSGFSIAATLHTSNRRFKFSTVSGEDFKVVDLGLRLADIGHLGREPVNLDPRKAAAQRERLKINGATELEIGFLMGGSRVELNAMTSRQFIDFLEAKLAEHRVRKVVPSADTLADTYCLFARGARMKQVVEAAMAAMAKQEIAAPTNLERRVKAHLKAYPESSWDEAVALICARSDGEWR